MQEEMEFGIGYVDYTLDSPSTKLRMFVTEDQSGITTLIEWIKEEGTMVMGSEPFLY